MKVSNCEWQDGGWDDSTQTAKEIQAKLQNKQEAALKRERALAYAFSHQVTMRSEITYRPRFTTILDPEN